MNDENVLISLIIILNIVVFYLAYKMSISTIVINNELTELKKEIYEFSITRYVKAIRK